MTIPTEFTIFNQTIRVVWQKDLYQEHEQLGRAELNNNLIVLQEPNEIVCVEAVEQTFWHEVMHHVFYKAGEEKLSFNERLVDVTGSIMNQVVNSIIKNLATEEQT